MFRRTFSPANVVRLTLSPLPSIPALVASLRGKSFVRSVIEARWLYVCACARVHVTTPDECAYVPERIRMLTYELCSLTRFSLADILLLVGTAGAGGMATPTSTRICKDEMFLETCFTREYVRRAQAYTLYHVRVCMCLSCRCAAVR